MLVGHQTSPDAAVVRIPPSEKRNGHADCVNMNNQLSCEAMCLALDLIQQAVWTVPLRVHILLCRFEAGIEFDKIVVRNSQPLIAETPSSSTAMHS